MRQYIRSYRPALATALTSAALVALAACGDKNADNNTLAGDSALGRDLALAQQDSMPQPQLQDVPATPAPSPEPAAAPAPAPRAEPRSTPRPAPRPARPAPRPTADAPAPAPSSPAPAPAAAVSGTVASGTRLSFAVNSKVCSNTTAVGEKFTADLSESVSATNGVSVPAGATGTFEVTEVKTAQNSNDQTYLRVRLLSVQFGGKTYPVDGTVQTASTERVRSATKGTDAKKVAGGAIIGAIAGQVIGKNTKGTVIGAAAGAAAGTAAAAATANFDTCLNNGAAIAVTLDGPLTVRPAPVP